MDVSATRASISLKIRALREATGLSQAAFAQRMGMDQAQLGRIETNAQNATIDTYARVIAALGISVADFFDDDAFRAVDDSLVVARAPQPAATREEAVLAAFRANPAATITTVAQTLGCSTVTVQRVVNDLRDQGRLRREGSRRAGRWLVVDAAPPISPPP